MKLIEVKIIHIIREGNTVADRLANLGVKLMNGSYFGPTEVP